VIFPQYATAQNAGPNGTKNIHKHISQLALKILPKYLTSNLQKIIFPHNRKTLNLLCSKNQVINNSPLPKPTGLLNYFRELLENKLGNIKFSASV
jgi:hypothetical protein